MNRTVYFADKAVVFTAEEPRGAQGCYLRLVAGEHVSRAKILKILETQNSVVVVSPEPDAVFAAFASEFVLVEAAGGIVVNDRGEWLMIHRNGRWDLPKGHLEPYETLEACAVREVAEETGVQGARVVRPLCETLHGYNLYGKWELKRTHWYELRVGGRVVPAPQTEEGIDTVQWCPPRSVQENLRTTFPTIRCVAACMNG